MARRRGLALTVAEEKELALPGADTAFTLYDMLDAIGGAKLGTQAITVLYKEEADAIAAEDVPIIPIIHKVLSKVGSGRAHFEVNAAMAPILKEAWLEA